MAQLLHLNGLPGVGKSTLARRFAAAHPGTLRCDIDVLRAMIGGWQDDVPAASRLARSAALAMITQYLSDGGDVVVPQLVARTDQLERFADAARRAGARSTHVLLQDDRDDATARAHDRCTTDELDGYRRGLAHVLGSRPDTVVVTCTDEPSTYDRLVAAVAETVHPPDR